LGAARHDVAYSGQHRTATIPSPDPASLSTWADKLSRRRPL
jgi:hypothetical protein